MSIMGEKIRVSPYLTHGTEINLRKNIDVNITGKTIRFLETNIGEYVHDLGVRRYF